MKETVDALMQQAVTKAIDEAAEMRFANVTAVNATAKTLTVDLAGVLVANVPYMKQYSPQIGERAWLLYQGSILVAIGCSN